MGRYLPPNTLRHCWAEWSVLAAVWGLAACSFAPAFAQGRYSAVFRDGAKISADTLAAWPLEFDSARLADRPLFDPANPARVVVDREFPPRLAGPYLELANGDILPGRVVGYRSDEAGQSARVSISLDGWLRSGDSNNIDIRAGSIARIVGGKEPQLPPDKLALVLGNGRKITPRSLRWTTSGLRLLADDGVLDVPFAELADVVLGIDRTSAVLADSMLAAKSNSPRLFRLATREGAALTAPRGYRQTENVSSRGRFRTRPPLKSYFVLQPSWSFDSIQVPEESICQCGIRAPDEMPLGLLSAETLVERSLLGIVYPWRRNQTLRGGVLASGELLADLGLGTHSHSELAFALPMGANSFSGWVGLDKVVGEGGCIECRVYLDDVSDTPAWESGLLRGGDAPVPIGPIEVSGARRLVLVTGFAHENRPPGADPLDIRDEAVWLAPTVSVDLALPRDAEWARYQLSGLSSWQPEGASWREAEFATRWSSSLGRFEPTIRATSEEPLTLLRTTRILANRDVLEYRAAGPLNPQEANLELRVDGVLLKRSESHERIPLAEGGKARSDTHCLWWDLAEYVGQEVSLELTLLRVKDKPLAWRGLSLVSVLANAPSGGKPLVPDVSLTELAPLLANGPSADLQPRADAAPGAKREPIRFLGREFPKGYGLARDSGLTFELKPEYRQFVAVAGCCRGWAGPLRVRIDDQVVWERPAIRSLEPAEQISLTIPEGAKTLALEAGIGGDVTSFSAFASAGFLLD